ncbi:MAG TPA: TRAP transporter substrate-binding protein [Symbiobacteriaceae bacterium]|nr:TRAP transporter substrate-binding protein [Symbiobacteriaceae bacterium]
MFQKVRFATVVLLALALLTACGRGAAVKKETAPAAPVPGGTAAAPVEKMVVKFSHVVAESTPKGQASLKFADEVKKLSNGRIEVQVFPNSQLYKDGEEIEALQKGAVHFLAPSTSKFTQWVPQWQLFDLPFAFEDTKAVQKAMEGPIGQKLFSLLEQKGMLGLGMWDNGFKVMSNSKRPLVKVDDFKGLKFRVQPAKVLEAQFKTWNASAVAMPFSEVYQALQSGVVDGAENPPSNLYSQKMHEVQKYVTVSNHGYLGYAVVTNAEWWKGLKPEDRKIFEEALKTSTDWVRTEAEKLNAADLEKVKASGKSEVIVLGEADRQAWTEASETVWAEFEGSIGKDLLDALRALRTKK